MDHLRLAAAVGTLCFLPCAASGQLPPAPSDQIERLAGVEPGSHIAYALISLSGKLLSAPTAPSTPPRLTAQCTRPVNGKLQFELLADFGNVPSIAYVPPWKPSGPTDLFPPRLQHFQLTMDFLGYTHVKPVKRQWEALQNPAGELRYTTPGLSSANMEPIAFYLQYLKALPTLRITGVTQGVIEFETTAWQNALRSEPLCQASRL